jgi:MoxR-like ATPase
MTDGSRFRIYCGEGIKVSDRNIDVPPFEHSERLDDPAQYIADRPLRDAVNVALSLGQPLLVTGEPGTGKTQLAGSIAYELELPPPLVFHTKTTSTAKDLFYRYDALRHFHDSHFQREASDVEAYINYEALGLAILLTMDPTVADPMLPPVYRGKGPTRSVVLIDEVDKAPRDLPNDILNEIERMSFTVNEVGKVFAADSRLRPILILTSNSEKSLPDPFLRRCVFYNIPFPEKGRLMEIVQRRLGPGMTLDREMLENALAHFEEIRSLPLRRRPATAECLSWLQVIDRMHIDVRNLRAGQAEALALSYSVLTKSAEDSSLVRRTLIEKVR